VDFEWIPLPEVGSILSFSEIRVSSDAFQKDLPYVVCIASFGGTKIPGMMKGKADTLKVGSPVRILVEPDNKPVYRFDLADRSE
jgi:uncharacterized protein